MIVTVSVAAVAPDIDLLLVIDHRGPTHSIGFALAVATIAWVTLRIARHPRAAVIGTLSGIAVVTHIGLDVLTAHQAVAALWPLTTNEFSLPFLVLPASPTDAGLFSVRGVALLGAEVAWSAALIVLAGWRIRGARVRSRRPFPRP